MPRPLIIKDVRFGQDFKKDEVIIMAIDGWCGKPCSSCNSSCTLDKQIPCSPNCENLNPDGTRNAAACGFGGCDAYELNIGSYVFDTSCGEEGFVVSLSSDGKTACVQYLTSDGLEEDTAACTELEVFNRPDKAFDFAEACQWCGYLHHANNCTIQPGAYCKRYHRWEH